MFTRELNFVQVHSSNHLSCHDPAYLSQQKVLAVLILALIFTKDTIQISDILRWIQEGHLSYLYPICFFPDSYKITSADQTFLYNRSTIKYRSLQKCTFNVAKFLDLYEFPIQNLIAISRRFLLELQLPSEIGDYVERLMASLKINQSGFMLSCEMIVMSLIIIVLKSLFGLDGYTEHSISKFATQINCMMDSNEMSGSKLFVWDDWVRYIECRKSVIIHNHFPSQQTVEGDLSTTLDSFVGYVTKEKNALEHIPVTQREKAYSIAVKLRLVIVNAAVEELPKLKKSKTKPNFLPSFTPQVSYLEEVLANWYSHGYTSDTAPPIEILTYDHTKTSVEFLVQPSKIIQFARSQGIDVVLKETPVHVDHTTVHEEFLHTSKPIIPCVLTDNVDDNSSDDLQQSPDVASPKPSNKKTLKSDGTGTTKSRVDNDDMLLELNKMKQSNESKEKKMRLSNDNGTSQGNICDWKNSSTHLQESTGKNKEGSSSVRNGHSKTPSNNRNTLTLHVPRSGYWVYGVGLKHYDRSFEHLSEPDFPHSFKWLLKLCSRILQSKTVDLYRILRLTEQLCVGEKDLEGFKIFPSQRLNVLASVLVQQQTRL